MLGLINEIDKINEIVFEMNDTIKQNRIFQDFLIFAKNRKELKPQTDQIKDIFSRDLMSLSELSFLLFDLNFNKTMEKKILINCIKKFIPSETNDYLDILLNRFEKLKNLFPQDHFYLDYYEKVKKSIEKINYIV